MNTLAGRVRSLEGDTRLLAEEVLARREELIERLSAVRALGPGGLRIRCHGDFHLGQCLWTGRDFVIIDFEGEPTRPLGERRLKRSCLSDVAGMCRSLDYAASAGLRQAQERGLAGEGDSNRLRLRRLAEGWSRTAQTAFLTGYLGTVDRRLIPESTEGIGTLLHAWTLHKASYEVDYELNNRPAWVEIPLRGILMTLDGANPPKGPDR
jgi:maltose alpha-D-glucosyltransferase/alpha-amylase